MTEESTAEAGTPALTPRQIITAMSGLVVAMLLAQLDNMIVAPALPTIVGDLGGLNHLSWVGTGYILASAVATPIWGKLGDLFGHKRTFMAAIVLFLIGSALCGVSQDMTQLVLFRALQGLGAGGLLVGILSVIGMLVPPRERGKYLGVMMAVMPVSFIGGPLVGGFITDNLSWRWAFYVNLPLGVLALFVIWSTLHLAHETRRTGDVVIDWPGIAVLTTFIVSLVLGVTWAGTEYPWGSWQVVTLFAVAVVGLLVFIRIERTAVEPVIGLHLFANRNFTYANVIGFVAGFAMFGTIYFLPNFQQFVQGKSATSSGLLLMPMMFALMLTSVGGGQLISRTGRYRAYPIVGTALLGIGLYLFSTMDVDTSTTTSAVYMVVMGLGLGCLMQTTNLIAQNSIELRDLGAGTGTFAFVRTLGGSIGLAVLGSIYTHRVTDSLRDSLGGHLPPGGGSLVEGMKPSILTQQSPELVDAFQRAVAAGTQSIFFAGALVTLLGFVVSWLVKEVPLRGSVTPAVAEAADDLDPTA